MNNSVFHMLLKDPSTTVTQCGTTLSEYLNSLASETTTLYNISKIQQDYDDELSGLESYRYLYSKCPTLYISDETKLLIGYESNDVLTMIKDFVVYVFRYIKDFITKAWAAFKQFFKDMFNIDERLKNTTDNSYAEFKKLYTALSPSDTSNVNATFAGMSIATMAPESVYMGLLKDFSEVVTDIQHSAATYIETTLRDIDKERKTSEAPVWITDAQMTRLQHLGVIITDTTVKHTNVFDEYPTTTLDVLGYTTLNQINDLEPFYQQRVWKPFSTMDSVVDKLKHCDSTIAKKERELKDRDDVNTAFITENIKHVQCQLVLLMQLFKALRSVQFALDFRRKHIILSGIDAIKKTTRTKTQ